MARRVIDTFWDRKTRNDINDNFKELYDDNKKTNDTIDTLVLESGKSDLEVVQARGGKRVLNDRLNDIEQSKRDKNQEIQMSDLSQEVKEGMTGGSVAVVGPDSIGNINVKAEAIDPYKTNFFDKGNNLFNGTFMSGFSYYASDGDFGYIAKSTEPNRYIALIPIEPGKTYNVTKLEGGNRFNLLLIDDYPRQNERSYASYRYVGGSGSSSKSHTFTNDVNASYIALHTNVDDSSLPKVIVTEGDYVQVEEAPQLKIKHYETATKTNEGVLRGSYLEGFAYFSLIGGEYGSIAYTSSENRFVVIAKIEKNKTYRVTKFEGGNRFNVALLKDAPYKGLPADLLTPVYAGTQSSARQTYVFNNDVDANYVAIHTNSGSGVLANVMITEGDASHDEYIPYRYIPSDLIYPKVETETSKSYVIFDDLNGVYDNVDIVSFTNPTEVQAQEIYDLYDELVSNYSDYVSREGIGKDSEGNDMYLYHFKPVDLETHMTYKLPKIIITTGTHGNEKSPVFGTYNMFKNICENWRDSDILEFLRFNVQFIVIPIVNPSGFNAHTRNNSNNVNLNRNFPTGWSSSGQQPGSGPASELETQNVISVLDEHSDADICIDYHNMYFRDGFMGYTWTADQFTNDIVLSTLKTMGRKWQKDYSFFPQDENHKFGYSTEEIQGSLALHASSYGMKDNLLEIVREVKWQEDSSLYDELTILCAEEFLVNVLKGSIKEGLM